MLLVMKTATTKTVDFDLFLRCRLESEKEKDFPVTLRVSQFVTVS